MTDFINVKTEQTQSIDLHALMESCTDGQLQHITNWIYKNTGLYPQKLKSAVEGGTLPNAVIIGGVVYRRNAS